MPLALQPERVRNLTMLYAIGRISLGAECQQLQAQLTDMLAAGEKDVVLNLSGVSQIDSTGIGILAMFAGRLSRREGRLRVCGAKGHVEEVLKISRLYDLVGQYSEAAAAAASAA